MRILWEWKEILFLVDADWCLFGENERTLSFVVFVAVVVVDGFVLLTIVSESADVLLYLVVFSLTSANHSHDDEGGINVVYTQ